MRSDHLKLFEPHRCVDFSLQDLTEGPFKHFRSTEMPRSTRCDHSSPTALRKHLRSRQDSAKSPSSQIRWIFFFFFCMLPLSSFWTSRGHRCVVPFPPWFLPSFFIAHRVQQSHCSSIFHRVLLTRTHALSLSASQFVHKEKSPRVYTRMQSGGFELTKLTYTRLEDNLIRHRGDRPI